MVKQSCTVWVKWHDMFCTGLSRERKHGLILRYVGNQQHDCECDIIFIQQFYKEANYTVYLCSANENSYKLKIAKLLI